MAVINDWKSSKAFDNELSKIEHYSEKHHPEMLPFIGSHYCKTGILLVGESHFYEYNDRNDQGNEKKYVEELWYLKPTPEVFSYKGNFNTREVIHNFLIHRRTKAHSMFRNPAQCVIDAYRLNHVSDSEAFNAFAFMNYFQRPALDAHQSIDYNREDAECAFSTFGSVCKVIRPKRVVFLSKKAYECFKSCCDEKSFSIPVDYVYHPTCRYWNKEDGKEKLKKLISLNKENIDFAKYQYYSKEEIKSISPGDFVFIAPKQKRFIRNQITMRLYENLEGVYEFAVHILVDENKVGIGYNIESQSVWIWNYDKKEYIDTNDLGKYKGLNELFLSFSELIEKL